MRGNRGGLIAAAAIVLLSMVLVLADAFLEPMQRWWTGHAFTTSVVGGLLVLAVTVLVVDQTLHFRDIRSRAQATAAQAAIILNQARRTEAAMGRVDGTAAERDAASDEARTYMTMVLIAAPVLITDAVPRAFLEQAQWLGVLFSRALAPGPGEHEISEISAVASMLQETAAPLLRRLNHSQRQAVGATDGDADGASRL